MLLSWGEKKRSWMVFEVSGFSPVFSTAPLGSDKGGHDFLFYKLYPFKNCLS